MKTTKKFPGPIHTDRLSFMGTVGMKTFQQKGGFLLLSLLLLYICKNAGTQTSVTDQKRRKD
jgi:hypothetical protein